MFLSDRGQKKRVRKISRSLGRNHVSRLKRSLTYKALQLKTSLHMLAEVKVTDENEETTHFKMCVQTKIKIMQANKVLA